MNDSRIEFWWLREEESRWPIDVRSVAFRGESFPRICSRPDGANFFIAMWNVEGEARLESEGKTLDLIPDSVMLIPPRKPHRYFALSEPGPWLKWWFTFDGAVAAQVMNHLELDQVVVEPLGPAPAMLFERLLTAAETPGITGQMDRSQAALRILYEISARREYGINSSLGSRFAQVIAWTQEHIGQKLSVAAMAEYANMSRFHFAREFKLAVGVSPQEFLVDAKLNRAKELLLSSRRTIKEVAYQTGWFDAAHFCRQFQRRTGCTPGQYRSRMHT